MLQKRRTKMGLRWNTKWLVMILLLSLSLSHIQGQPTTTTQPGK